MEQTIRYIYKQVAEKKLTKEEARTMLLELQSQQKAEAEALSANEDIAIIGMACRFPGADNTDQFWANILNGANFIRPYPKERHKDFEGLLRENSEDGQLPDADKMYLSGGYLNEVDKFDAGFFKMPPREARYMDPIQRVFLETAWEAVENAGYGGKLYGSHTGIYVGKDHASASIYKNLDKTGDPMTITGSWTGILASRLAYIYNLTGPSVVVDTACSSGLVSVHIASQALKNKECDMAIAGGIHISQTPLRGGQLSMVESEEGLVKTFDKDANGTVWGEGCGAVLLKPLSRALADGDYIHAVIKGSAINNDGASNGITAPNAEAQENVILSAWKSAGIEPETIGWIEAHATGTVLGDPIEIKGLTNAFRHFTTKNQFCGIGTAKPSIGHLVGASGMASLIKVVQALKNRYLPASLNFEEPNPYINFVESPIYVNDKPRSWVPAGDFPRRAGVNAFGFSGTNCHVVLEEAPLADTVATAGGNVANSGADARPASRPHVLALSARGRQILAHLVQRYSEFLDQKQSWNLDDLCYTANVGRGHYTHRLIMLVENAADLEKKIARLQASDLTALSEADQRALQADGIFYGEYKIVSDLKTQRSAGEMTEGERKQLNKTANKKLKALATGEIAYVEGLTELCHLYAEGADLDWDTLYQGQKRRKIVLPVYPFERTRYWIDYQPTPKKHLSGVDHPLFDYCLAESVEQEIYLTEFAVDKHWVLKDHIVAGSHIIPGTTYLEMARQVGEHYYDAPIELQEVLFISPLDVAKGEKKQVQTILKIGTGYLEFIIASKLSEGGWQRHAEGKICPVTDQPQYALDLTAIRAQCTGKVERSSEGGAKSVFEFGPHWLNNLRVDVGDNQILVELNAAEASRKDFRAYGLHPALLDNAVNVASQSIGQGPYLPLSYRKFTIYSQMPERFFTYLKCKTGLSGNLETIAFDIILCDEHGQIFGVVEDYIIKRFRSGEWKKAPTTRPYYEFGWVPTLLDVAPGAGTNQAGMTGNILIFKDRLGIADAVSKELRAAGANPIEISFSDTCQRLSDNQYTMTGEMGDYLKILGSLKDKGIKRVLHFASITGEVNDLSALKDAECYGVYSLLRFIQAYFTNKFSEALELVLFTERANLVTGRERTLNPQQSALVALGKTIGAENPNVAVRCIDLDLDTPGSEFAILHELQASTYPYQVAYRDGQRYVEEFRRLEVNPDAAKKLQVKADGVYLITGGTGALGLEFAKHLATQANVKLALLNRSALPERGSWDELIQADESAKLAKRLKAIKELEALGAEVNCYAVDTVDAAAMKDVIEALRAKYGKINGVIHAAGVAGDGFLILKKEEVFRNVVAPKIEGTWILHDLTRQDNMDFFVLFSSINSFLAGPGQGDYAAANAYLDSFAALRNQSGQRTIAINWPAWKEVGMALDYGITDDRGLFKGVTTARGLEVFDELLSTDLVRAIPAELNWELLASIPGELPIKLAPELKATVEKLRAGANAGRDGKGAKASSPASGGSGKGGSANIEENLARIWAEVLEVAEVDIYDNFYDMGGDSILATKLVKEIKREYPEVDISDIFSYPTVVQLAEQIKKKKAEAGETDVTREETPAYTAENAQAAATTLPPVYGTATKTAPTYAVPGQTVPVQAGPTYAVPGQTVPAQAGPTYAVPGQTVPAHAAPAYTIPQTVGNAASATTDGENDAVAIIGMACKVPGANDLGEFWFNLKQGISSIGDFPAERRKDTDIFLAPELRNQPGMYFKGGFLKEVDKFDYEYFGLIPREAMMMEPSQRLFLETAMEAIEEAGYGGNKLYGTKTGVFAGRDHANESQYKRMITDADPMVKTGSWSGILSRRLSYILNLRGPSMVIDTACSSGLVSVHQACMALKNDECTMAIAGGINIFSLALKSPMFGSLESHNGSLRSFDKDANGTVWGEGVGVVVLKSLKRALADGDQIHAVIRGGAINNDGASSGLTAPNPEAQEEVIVEALEKTGIHPESISYIETHASATAIGDPIEVKAITNAYRRYTQRKRFMPMGTVKPNVGHLVGASGIVALIKVVLSLKNRVLPPTLNFKEPNPHINFEESPIYVNTEYRRWENTPEPRRAAISSFGFSGTNAHMIVEEAPVVSGNNAGYGSWSEENQAPEVVTLSARTRETMVELLKRYQRFFTTSGHVTLRDLVFTANTGRGHYACRLALVVRDLADFREKIAHLVEAPDFTQVQLTGIYYSEHKIVSAQRYTGQPGTMTESIRRELSEKAVEQIQELVQTGGILTEPGLAIIADFYAQGANIDWAGLYAGQMRRRISLPVYPFARKRVWYEPNMQSLLVRETGSSQQDATAETARPVQAAEPVPSNSEEVAETLDTSMPTSEMNTPVELTDGMASVDETSSLESGTPTENVDAADSEASDIVAMPTETDTPEVSFNFTAEEMAEQMCQIWAKSFGISEVKPDDDFFEMGGNSLLAMVIIGKITQVFGIQVEIDQFLQYTTVNSMVEHILTTRQTSRDYSTIEPVEEREYYPTSSAQMRILVITRMEESSTGYNLPAIITIEGSLDYERFSNAFKNIVKRHDSLRTSFAIIEGQPVQVVHKDCQFEVGYREAAEEELPAIAREFVRPFNLNVAPLIRVELVKFAPDKHLVLFDMHHIISDGTSLGIIGAEFNELYHGWELPALRIQYRDYAVWQNELFASGAIKKQEDYWLTQFAGEIPILSLPTDYPRPAVMSFIGESLRFNIDAEITSKVNKLARENSGTVYMVLLAAYNILLAKYSGQEDIIVGTPIAGRHHPDLNQLVGMFVNSLVMRNRPAAEKTVGDFLEEVKTTAFGAYEHQDYPFEMLVDKLRLQRDLSRNPLFDTMFALQNMHLPKSSGTGLTAKFHQMESSAIQFDLQLEAFEANDAIECKLEYSTSLFRRESMERFIGHYLNILRTMVEHPELRIGEISMISPEEREQLIYGFNDNAAEFSRTKSIYRLFEEHAAANPEKTALIYRETKMTYGELNERANRLAKVLRQNGATTDDVIGVLMERSPLMVESILAIWKAGAAYIPLDPEYPVKRLSGILRDSGAKILLTTSANCEPELVAECALGDAAYQGSDQENAVLENAEGNEAHGSAALVRDADASCADGSITVLMLDTDAERINSESAENLDLVLDMNSLAYVIYTSGSTGKPKGAMVEHIGMMNHIQAKVNDLQLTGECVVVQNASHCFDISVWQFFVALTLGGTTVIYPQEVTLNPQEFISSIITDGATILEVVPSFLAVMLDYLEVEQRSLDGLDYLLVTGEIVKPNLVKRWFNIYPTIKMVNAYGPTEASDDITHHIMSEVPEMESVPIGRPVQNFHIYMVDKNMQLCPVGVKGEICVAGVGVGRGYLNNPEKTREAFTVDPFVPEEGVRLYKTGDLGRWLPDGTIEFFGRKDYQVKIRGFRIELGEIETKLTEQPEIKEAVVVDREDKNGNKYLCAYITVRAEFNVQTMKERLLESLPDYMIPAYFITLERLPLNPNGKVDRKALPEPDGLAIVSVEYVAPRNEIEERLARVWAEVLGVEKVGVNDNFFEIGGNSIKLITLAFKLNQEFRAEIEGEIRVIDLFRLTIIAQLAEYFTGNNENEEIQEYTL